MNAVRLDSDDFELFGLPRRQAQDRATLDARWRELLSQVHPDRHVTEGAAARRVAMQWSMRINEAHRRLRDPLQRAATLCELMGVPIEAERNTAMPAEFLQQQMAWREALDEAGSDPVALRQLADTVDAYRRDAYQRLELTLDGQHDAQAAAAQVRALMFVERFAADVARRLDGD